MSWQPPPPQGGGGGAGAGGGSSASGWAPPPPQQQQQWSGGAGGAAGGGGHQQQHQQHHHQQQASTFAPPSSSQQQQGPYGAPNPPQSQQHAQGGGGVWGAPQPQYGGYNQQTAAFAQAALGAALGAGGMDAANLMAGLASAAMDGGGGGSAAGGRSSASLFEKGASWATSRLGALVGGGGSGGGGNEQYAEGSPGFGGNGAGPNQQQHYRNQRRGGLFSFLSPVGGASCLSVSASYCRAKMLLLSAPWLRRWPYARVREHHDQMHAAAAAQNVPARDYAPPSRDVHAPDLYIPAMALATLALLRGAAEVFSTHSSSSLASSSSSSSRSHRRHQAPPSFSPDSISAAVSGLATAWLAHGVALKAALWALGSGAAQAVPLAELAAYAGYPMFHGAAVCAVRGGASLASSSGSSSSSVPSSSPTSASSSSTMTTTAETANAILSKLGSGSASGATGAARWAGDAAVLWGGAAAGVFLVRSLKRVLFHDARGGVGNGYGGGYSGGGASSSSRSNYVLLLLWFAQFPLVAWLARGCRVVS